MSLKEVIFGFAPLIAVYPFASTIIIVIIGGSLGVFSMAFLSAQGILPIWIVFGFGVVADVITGLFWFTLPKIKILHKIKIPRFIKNQYDFLSLEIKPFEKKELFLFLFLDKFVMGTRWIAVTSVSINKAASFKKYLLVDIIASSIWSVIIVASGWLVGRGYLLLMTVIHNTQETVSIAVIIFIIVFLIRHNLHKYASKKINHHLHKRSVKKPKTKVKNGHN